MIGRYLGISNTHLPKFAAFCDLLSLKGPRVTAGDMMPLWGFFGYWPPTHSQCLLVSIDFIKNVLTTTYLLSYVVDSCLASVCNCTWLHFTTLLTSLPWRSPKVPAQKVTSLTLKREWLCGKLSKTRILWFFKVAHRTAQPPQPLPPLPPGPLGSASSGFGRCWGNGGLLKASNKTCGEWRQSSIRPWIASWMTLGNCHGFLLQWRPSYGLEVKPMQGMSNGWPSTKSRQCWTVLKKGLPHDVRRCIRGWKSRTGRLPCMMIPVKIWQQQLQKLDPGWSTWKISVCWCIALWEEIVQWQLCSHILSLTKVWIFGKHLHLWPLLAVLCLGVVRSHCSCCGCWHTFRKLHHLRTKKKIRKEEPQWKSEGFFDPITWWFDVGLAEQFQHVSIKKTGKHCKLFAELRGFVAWPGKNALRMFERLHIHGLKLGCKIWVMLANL